MRSGHLLGYSLVLGVIASDLAIAAAPALQLLRLKAPAAAVAELDDHGRAIFFGGRALRSPASQLGDQQPSLVVNRDMMMMSSTLPVYRPAALEYNAAPTVA
jgi:hypothetical protein